MDHDEPVLMVEGVPYRVRFNAGTLVRLQSRGFGAHLLHDEFGNLKPITLALCFEVLAACISHGERKFTGEQLADLTPFSEVNQAIGALQAAYADAVRFGQVPRPPASEVKPKAQVN